jgi:hypothetical protein
MPRQFALDKADEMWAELKLSADALARDPLA